MIYNLLRFFLTTIFAVLGYKFAADFFPSVSSWVMALITMLGAFIGFTLPSSILFLWQKFLKRLTETMAVEVVSQIKSKLPSRSKPAPPFTTKGCPPLILDTSAVIDGRIGDILKTGFLHGVVIVSDFILVELQAVADSPDDLKRARGRRGLAILEDIKKNPQTEFKIMETKFRRKLKTDERLIKLAKKLRGAIITSDFNLNKVAKVSGITVLNVNELANAVKTSVLPGEEISIRVVQEGKEEGQGVGYLSDGTMVVVENGKKYLGKEIKVEVFRLLQTEAGRMIFAKPK
jgi:uncharacterized protein YacL